MVVVARDVAGVVASPQIATLTINQAGDISRSVKKDALHQNALRAAHRDPAGGGINVAGF